MNKKKSKAKITFVEGELFYIDSNSVYLLGKNITTSSDLKRKENLYHVKLKDIIKINLPYFSNDEWVEKVIFLQVVPAVLLGVTAGMYTSDLGNGLGISAIALSPAMITSLFFKFSSPNPEIDKNSSKKEIEDYRKYSRFPFIMSKETKKDIFDKYNLSEY